MTKTKQRKYAIDVDDLSIGEIEEVEKLSGVPSALGDISRGVSGPVIAALVCVWQRRTEPTFDMSAARNIKFSQVDLIVDKPEDPTVPDEQKP